jgi:hypothetical protein
LFETTPDHGFFVDFEKFFGGWFLQIEHFQGRNFEAFTKDAVDDPSY